MPEFTITRHIDAPVETVWGVLDDFGAIQQWSSSVKFSELTTEGPVGEGSTRYCDFTGMGGVNERIDAYEPHRRMTVNYYETFRLPVQSAVADYKLESDDSGTSLTIDYSYTPNLLGRLIPRVADKQLRREIGALAENLGQESERIAAAG